MEYLNQSNNTENIFIPPGLEPYRTEPFNIDFFKARMIEAGYSDELSLIESTKMMENLLGSGGNAHVYKIPKIDGYVLRTPHRFREIDQTVLTSMETVNDPFPNLNIGQAVATLGNDFILKEQLGIPAGVPYGEIRSRNEEEGNRIYQSYLSQAAELPQSSYDSLAELFSFLNQHGYAFDPSKANNILLDKKHMRFNVVDINKLDQDQKPNNNFSYMTIVLMDNAYAWRVKDHSLQEELTSHRREILTKTFEACKKVNLPLPSEDDSSLEYSFELAGLKGKWPEFRKEFELK